MVIKKIITTEEWGMSTLKELNYIHPEQKVTVKYNYWDYIDGFNKVLLYENANRKHSWFIKICSNIFDRNIPNWFCKWWTLYGPSKYLEGKIHGQEIIDLINVKISKYYDTATMEPQVMEDLSPFKRITRKLQMKKGLISKSEAIAIYMEEMGTFKKLDLKQVVKTTEETITIDSDNHTFRILSDNDLAPYRDIYRFMHIGLVQVAFKPLTLRGLPESFIAALRDGTIQTSLAYGSVYFNAYPNLHISLQDENSLSSLMLNVKLHGYDYMPGTEVQCFHINKSDKIVNFNAFSKLFENDTAIITAQHVNVMIKQNNYVNIYMSILGDHIIFLHEKVDKLISLLPTKLKGKEKVAHSSLQPPPDIEDFKIKDYSDLENFLEKKFKGGGVQPINNDNFDEGEPSNKKEFYDSLNKVSERYARKPVQRMYCYPRPTPQDILLEEHEHIITNSYNGKEICEWNIDGYTNR
ncbi:hypothetical protein H5410_045222 [Solanum commersonii]|uniref:Uncharacterized protein n=1 Tax=Solanum commersonii TaxID=4109 RepID=A0A9J5XC46_SOLCO|nr:hypothetical protein H5410_045222 [Solanum commersonii]